MYARKLLSGLLFLCLAAGTAQAGNSRIVMQTDLGVIELELFDDTNPITVANFKKYLEANVYDGLMFHRSVNAAGAGIDVIQAGQFQIVGTSIFAIVTDPPIPNEFNASNLRGTIAMARLGGDPNSATSQWFINVTDNVVLDGIDGGFTVFGQVTSGFSSVDAIHALPTVDISGTLPFATDVPVKDYTGGSVFLNNLVLINDMSYLPSMPIVPWAPVVFGGVGLFGLALGRRRNAN